MKVLLVALNARYVHTNLAIRCLSAALEEDKCRNVRTGRNIKIREFTINDQLDRIAGEIYEEKPDVIGFSCYIWNIAATLVLIRRLRCVLPKTKIIVGGPEVAYDGEKILAENLEIDVVILGEGEITLPKIINTWEEGEDLDNVEGIVWRGKNGRIVTGELSPVLPDLDDFPDPYQNDEDFKGRLVYVETSRGCPFSCQYCISSTIRGLRFLNPEKFRVRLIKLFENGARTIKFVDRTFNTHKKHAFAILDIFKEEALRYCEINEKSDCDEGFRAHCEMAGELLDDDWIEYLSNYPGGLIQLEIGVQSTHTPTLKIINRTQHFEQWKGKVYKLQHNCHIPIHLDLIAGLPEEGWGEFACSFNDVYSVSPNQLQLGFLKVLKGSGIWKNCAEYGLVYSPDAPYMILKTKELNHDEMLGLHKIEDIVEKYYNSGRFTNSLEYLIPFFDSPFNFFSSFANYWHKNNWFARSWKGSDLFGLLWEYMLFVSAQKSIEKKDSNRIILELSTKLSVIDIWKESLRFDYCLFERPGTIKSGFFEKNMAEDYNQQREIIRNSPIWLHTIPELGSMDRRRRARSTGAEMFKFDVPYLLQEGELRNEKRVVNESCWYLFYYSNSVKYYKYLINN